MTGAEVFGVPIIEWISTYGYAILVPLFIVEGMLTGFTAGALASLGWFNPWFVILAYVGSKVVADTFVYFTARYATDFLKRFDFSRTIVEMVTKTEHGEDREWVAFVDKHFFKSLFIAKVAPLPLMDIALLIAAGVMKISPRRVYVGVLLGQPIWSAGIVGAGYYFGSTVQDAKHLLNIAGVILLVIFGMAILYSKFTSHYISKHTKLSKLIHKHK